jgi:hypothetical protein
MVLETTILWIILGTLAAIVYSLRILVLLERRIARMDENIVRITNKIINEEHKIETIFKVKKVKKKIPKRRKK